MTNGGSLEIYARDDEEHGRRHRPRAQALARARLERNTLVIFTSDNGGERYSFNWPFSFQKMYLWEGGMRVPAIVRWPGMIPAGPRAPSRRRSPWTGRRRSSPRPATAADPRIPLDGEDLMPVCTGARAPSDRTLFWRTDRPRRGAAWAAGSTCKDGNASICSISSIDPGEKNDLRPTHGDVFEKLRTAYLTWNTQMLPRSTTGGPPGNEIR